ncbi:MAG: hypothetical protein E7589_03225 [Ruminococcaceae bacterium]|nr:hypothetical protein [Oscillospiraceae bacterium]
MVLTLIIVGYILISAGLYALSARKHTWMGSAMRTVLIIVSVIISCLISTAISAALGDSFSSFIVEPLLSSLGDLTSSVPLLANTVIAIASMILAPFIFIVIFSVLRLVLSLLGKIPEKLLIEKLVPQKVNVKWVSPIVGAVNGALVAVITIVPICGYLLLASNVVNATAAMVDTDTTQTAELAAEETGEEGADLLDTIASLGENPAVKAVGFIASPVFDALTTADVPTGHGDGSTVKFVLSKDIANVFDIFDHVTVFMDDMTSGEVSEHTQQNMHDLSHAFASSEWTLCFASDTFSSMADAWLEGDDFMGMSQPELPAVFEHTFSQSLEIIGNVTPATVEDDLNTIFDVFYYFLKGDLMNGESNADGLMTSLSESDILSSIIDTLEANERFAPLADEIIDMGLRVVATSIGKVELGSDEQYDALVGEISNSLTNTLSMSEDERDEYIKESIKTAFTDYGTEIPEDVALTCADKMIAELGGDGEITDEEVHAYLDSYVVVEE